MKLSSILVASVSVVVLASCAGPAGMTVREVESMSRVANLTGGALQFEMSVKEPLKSAVHYAAQTFEVGDRIRAGAEREFIYPTSYEPPQVDSILKSVAPTSPKDFETLNTGTVANLVTRQAGATVLIEGTVTITEFQGFTRMEGAFGQPILDSKERLVTENRVEMPKFVTYTTPVCVAIEPGNSSSFELSAPKKGTKMTFSIEM